MQLIMANIDANDMRSAALQQAIGETARGLPDIEAVQMRDIQSNMRQRAVQLEAAARYETIEITRVDFK
jgi:hypothetical protein